MAAIQMKEGEVTATIYGMVRYCASSFVDNTGFLMWNDMITYGVFGFSCYWSFRTWYFLWGLNINYTVMF